MMVTGPSLRRATFILAPKTPVSTWAPRSRRADTTAPTRGSATGPGAAADQDGRRPLDRSAYSVNWLMTRSGALTSEQDFSPSRIRRPHSLAASLAASSRVSSWVTPTRTSSPGSSIAPATSPSTVTLAWLTRCTTARIARQATAPGRVPGGYDPGRPAVLHPAVTLLPTAPAFFHPLHQPGPPGQRRARLAGSC